MPLLLSELLARVGHSRTRVHVVETSKGRRNKFDLDPELSAFKLAGVLPGGHSRVRAPDQGH